MNDQTPFAGRQHLETVTTDEVLHISQTMTRMRLMIGRRVIGRMAIAKLAPELELLLIASSSALGIVGGHDRVEDP